jgi:hypothetical protein
VLLRREDWRDNYNRTYRIYKEEGLEFEKQAPVVNWTTSALEHGFRQ